MDVPEFIRRESLKILETHLKKFYECIHENEREAQLASDAVVTRVRQRMDAEGVERMEQVLTILNEELRDSVERLPPDVSEADRLRCLARLQKELGYVPPGRS